MPTLETKCILNTHRGLNKFNRGSQIRSTYTSNVYMYNIYVHRYNV